MKMIMAKIYPEDDELLCDLYHRMKEGVEYYTNNHQDMTITINQDTEENCLLIKSLKLGENVN